MDRLQRMRDSWAWWMSQSATPVGPGWLQLVWTFLFSCGVAAAFTIVGFAAFAQGDGAWRNLAGWGTWYLNYLFFSLCIGYSIHGLFHVARRVVGVERIGRFRPWQRLLYFSAIPMTGVAIGTALAVTLGPSMRGGATRQWVTTADTNSVVGSLLLSVLAWVVISQYFFSRQRRLVAERRAAQAQLQLLQGQMEPHFLFNALANVLSLMDTDAPRAKVMLESFTDYLRASLGSLRGAEQTLGDELALIEAYLRVVKVRMEDRLQYGIDVPDGLRSLRLPALSVQPLVENAIVHGLEPKIEGGRVTLTARALGGRLSLCVCDDGLGMDPARRSANNGTGTALNNIRERLQQMHGDRGTLLIEPATPHGVRATLSLPLPD